MWLLSNSSEVQDAASPRAKQQLPAGSWRWLFDSLSCVPSVRAPQAVRVHTPFRVHRNGASSVFSARCCCCCPLTSTTQELASPRSNLTLCFCPLHLGHGRAGNGRACSSGEEEWGGRGRGLSASQAAQLSQCKHRAV